MNGPGGSRSKPKRRHKVIGWVMIVVGAPLMVLMPWAFLGFEIDGIGYLVGGGEEITVTVTKSSDGENHGDLGANSPGEGYYTFEGEREPVRVWGVENGEVVEARLRITSAPGEEDAMAYASWGTAFWDVVWGLVFMLACVVLGGTLFRMGRGLKS